MEKVAPTYLMKVLKGINAEIDRIFVEERKFGYGPIGADGQFLFDSGYSHEENTKKLLKLFEEERKIRMALAAFNSTHILEGYGFTMLEALLRIEQLRRRIKNLTRMASKETVFLQETEDLYSFKKSGTVYRLRYDLQAVKEELRAAQEEVNALQMAVDAVNLTATIDF